MKLQKSVNVSLEPAAQICAVCGFYLFNSTIIVLKDSVRHHRNGKVSFLLCLKAHFVINSLFTVSQRDSLHFSLLTVKSYHRRGKNTL